jgi:Tfp pilus assembly protein PilV
MKKKLKIKSLISGQSIIEVVVALALVVLVILGLVRVTVSSINNSGFAKDQRTATKYAQEGLENARKEKEENEATFWLKSGAEEETIGKFEREIIYTEVEDDQQMHIQVIVSWDDSRGAHQSNLETYLTKWR